MKYRSEKNLISLKKLRDSISITTVSVPNKLGSAISVALKKENNYETQPRFFITQTNSATGGKSLFFG